VKITFYAGGPGVLGQQVLVAVNPPSQAQQEVTQPGFASGGPVIPYEQTSIPGLGKNLGTDGWAYGEKDNGTLVDVTPTAGAPMYNFPWPNASAYVLSIQANYIDLTESAVLGLVPEFCVGQKVTFVTAWNGSTSPMYAPPNVVWPNTIYVWALSSTFVNRDTPGTGGASDTWDIDPASLNSVSPFGYWTTGEGKNAYLHETLHFYNGQSATVFASGQFNMFRPKVRFIPGQAAIPMLADDYLELGNEAGVGTMTFDAAVKSKSNFPGIVDFTQLNRRAVTLPFESTLGQYWLDNRLLYNNGVGAFPPPTDVNPNGVIFFSDNPGISDFGFDQESITDDFKTYLIFKPDPQDSSIWVTLGIVTWGWSAEQWFWVMMTPLVTPPTYTDPDDFPTWPHIGFNRD
jgi:hypothetical protein